MTTEQHIEKLEKDVNVIKEDLATLIDLVREMNKGLYGDPKHLHVGVIEKQKIMQTQIDELQKDIKDIHQKNKDQDIDIKAKKSLKSEAFDWGQRIIGWIIQAIVIYAVVKGVIGADALLK
jgi:hypothetical protein